MLENCSNLEDCEAILSPKIKEISLLGQIELTRDDLRELGRMISSIMSFNPSRGTNLLREQTPVSLCCFLVWAGIMHYEAGNYWKAVHNLAGLPQGGNWERKWGMIFISSLLDWELPIFRGVHGHLYVTPILAHGGIPDYSLEDFFERLLYPIITGHIEVDITDTEEILEELKERPELFHFMDKPIKRFFLQTGKAAEDFLGRCIAMAQSAYEEEVLLSAEELDIPARIVKRFNEWWNTRRIQLSHKKSNTRFKWPKIQLNPEYGEISLAIPEQRFELSDEVASIVFEVATKNGEIIRQLVEYFKSGRIIRTNESRITLPEPSESYEVRLFGDDRLIRAWSFQGIAVDTPWLAFHETRKTMIANRELPRGPVWLVCLKNQHIEPSSSIIEEGLAFYGKWSAYRACLLDLSFSDKLCLSGGKREKTVIKEKGIDIPIASEISREPVLQGGEMIPLTVSNGNPVYSSAPRIRIPSPGDLTRWRMSVVPVIGRASQRKELDPESKFVSICKSGDSSVEILLSKHPAVECHEVNQFSVYLRGPLGRDYSFRFVLIKDLRVEFDEPLYLPSFDDDPEIKFRIKSDLIENLEVSVPGNVNGQTAGAWSISIPPAVARVKCTASLNGSEDNAMSIPLTVYPPRLRIAVQGVKERSTWQWSDSPLEISRMEWEESNDIFLLIDAAGIESGKAELTLKDSKQKVVRDISRGKARFELKPFSDTLASLGQPASLFTIRISTDNEQIERFPAIVVRTHWTIENFRYLQTVKGGKRYLRLSWEEMGEVSNRVFRIWNLWRPWAEPLVRDVPDGCSEIRFALAESDLPPGDYLLESEIEDPWKSDSGPRFVMDVNKEKTRTLSIGSEKERQEYKASLNDTWEEKITRISFQHAEHPDEFRSILPRISLPDKIGNQDLANIVALMLFWLTKSENGRQSVKMLWDYLVLNVDDAELSDRLAAICQNFAKLIGTSTREKISTLLMITEASEPELPFKEGDLVRNLDNGKVGRFEGIGLCPGMPGKYLIVSFADEKMYRTFPFYKRLSLAPNASHVDYRASKGRRSPRVRR
jgi:hypothetical protein